MKRAVKIWILSTMLPLFTSILQAQTTSHAHVSATVVNPTGLVSEMQEEVVMVYTGANSGRKGETGRSKVTLANFKLDGDQQDLFDVTLPGSFTLYNTCRSCSISAISGQEEISALVLPNGQKQVAIEVDLAFENKPAPGKHNTAPYEVTVNFN